jgi:hypothetical protein
MVLLLRWLVVCWHLKPPLSIASAVIHVGADGNADGNAGVLQSVDVSASWVKNRGQTVERSQRPHQANKKLFRPGIFGTVDHQ